MSRIELLKKGSEDIFYLPADNDITVFYFLMCEINKNNNVVKSISFAYSSSEDAYFAIDEDDKVAQIKTLADAEAYEVAKECPPSLDSECRMSQILDISISDNPFLEKWAIFHEAEYPYNQ